MNFRYDPKEEKLVVSKSSRIEYHQLNIWLTRHVKGYRYMPAFKMGVWNGQTSYFDNGKINLGLWRECLRSCKEIEARFIIDNKEEFPLNRDVTLDDLTNFCKDFFKDHKIKDKKTGELKPFIPYDYQIETAYKILKNRYCMAEVATSGGKSLVISIIIFYILHKLTPEAKFLIIVPSITLVTQFTDNIYEYFFGFNNDNINLNDDNNLIRIEEIMSDKPRKFFQKTNPNVFVGCYQSLEKYPKEFFKQFHTVACDEAHGCKAPTLISILKKTFFNAYNRFGVSGTFPEDDTLEILTIQSVLGPKVTQIEAKTLVSSGTITPMTIKSVLLNHNNPEIQERLNYIRKMGAGADAFRFEKEFMQQSDARLEFIKKIIDKCDSNCLLLFHTIEYGTKIFNKLREEIPNKEFFYIDGEVNGRTRDDIKKEMEKVDGKLRCLVASFGTVGTGYSINNLHYLVMADSYKSEQIVVQAIGRVLRLFDGKKQAVIFDLVDVFDSKDQSNILFKHYSERKKFYQKRDYPQTEIKINLY